MLVLPESKPPPAPSVYPLMNPIAGDLGYRCLNYLTVNQGGVETDATGLESTGAGSIVTRDATVAKYGSASVKTVVTATSAVGFTTKTTGSTPVAVPLPSGISVSGGCWLKGALGNETVNLRVRAYDSTGAFTTGHETATTTLTLTTDWVWYSVVYQMSGADVCASIIVRTASSQTSTWYADGLVLCESAVAIPAPAAEIAGQSVERVGTPLVLWYTMWDKGGIMRDRSGMNNHGTVYGAAIKGGPTGRVLEFDGSDDYIDCGNSRTLSLVVNRKMAWEFWVKPDNAGEGNLGVLVAKNTDTGYRIRWNLSGSVLRVEATAGFTTTAANRKAQSELATGKWHHIIVNFNENDDNKFTVYANGVLVTDAGTDTAGVGLIRNDMNTAAGGTATPLLLGANTTAGANCYDGQMALCRVYRRCLVP